MGCLPSKKKHDDSVDGEDEGRDEQKRILQEWYLEHKDIHDKKWLAAQYAQKPFHLKWERTTSGTTTIWKERAEDLWKKHLGSELEPALESGAIALLDAHWLVNYAFHNTTTAEGEGHGRGNDDVAILPSRRELPPEAFLTTDQVRWATTDGSLHIIALSYMWLHPCHPDPRGETLRRVAQECRFMLCHRSDGALYVRYGVFWDYASLFQHPDPSKGIHRAREHDELFRRGLECLPVLYAHPYTYVFRMTKFPAGYPRGYDLPGNANCATYVERGWPIVESSWASICKNDEQLIELEDSYWHDGNPKRAPMTPARMRERLQEANFTNEEQDRQRVMDLYEMQLAHVFRLVTELNYDGLHWDDSDIVLFSELIESGYLAHVASIDLSENVFGDEGCEILADALLNAPVELSNLNLSNPSSHHYPERDLGVAHLAPILVGTERVRLNNCGIGLVGCRATAESARIAGDSVRLRFLHMKGNSEVGNVGVMALADLFCRHLREVDLSECHVGDEGCRVLADAAEAFRCCPLESLYFYGWSSTDTGITKNGCNHLARLIRKCPRFQCLGLPERLSTTTPRIFESRHVVHYDSL